MGQVGQGVYHPKTGQKAKILGAGNSKRTIANAMPELSSVNRALVQGRVVIMTIIDLQCVTE